MIKNRKMEHHKLFEMMQLMGVKEPNSYKNKGTGRKWKPEKIPHWKNGKPGRRAYSNQPRTLRQ